MVTVLHDFVSAKSDGGDSSLVRPSDWNAGHVITGITPVLILDYALASDISALSLPAATWTDMIANQNFTKASSSTLISVSVASFSQSLDTSAGDDSLGVRINIDSGGTPLIRLMGGQVSQAAYLNPFTGVSPIWLSGITSGSHTIKIQCITNGGGDIYCRASTTNEFLRIQIVEWAA